MRRRWLVLAVSATVVILLLFDVEPVFDVALPAEVIVADSEQEARYAACYAARDEAIHRTAFTTIDNPDVQKEFITSQRARAARECRSQFPEKTQTVSTPLRFNLIDLAPRYW